MFSDGTGKGGVVSANMAAEHFGGNVNGTPTDFPDIRLKSAIHSADEGSLLIIPREGGYLVRMYIELDKLSAHERIADRHVTIDRLIAAAGRILWPYTLEVKEVAW